MPYPDCLLPLYLVTFQLFMCFRGSNPQPALGYCNMLIYLGYMWDMSKKNPHTSQGTHTHDRHLYIKKHIREKHNRHQTATKTNTFIHTVGGRNPPAPVDWWFIPLFIGVQPSKVVQDFFHPQYQVKTIQNSCSHREKASHTQTHLLIHRHHLGSPGLSLKVEEICQQ